MVDSSWENLPASKTGTTSYMSVVVDVYCPGQIVHLQQDNVVNGFWALDQLVTNMVRTGAQVEHFEKQEKKYKNKVVYLEDPYFFNEWYGFMYYSNGSDYTFQFEKHLEGCTGHKVVNERVDQNLHVVSLAPGETKVFMLKRTKRQSKFIPGGKVLQQTDYD